MSKKMKIVVKTSLAASIAALAAGCTSAPKVLVDHSFRGKSMTSKVLLETAGAKVEGKELYNSYIRLCDLKDSKEVECKDTLVLPNVVADTIY